MKYLKKFQTNADYQAFKNSSDWVTPNISVIKENVSGNDFNIVFEPFASPAALFTFTVNGNEYQAEEGMTFYDWALSEYYDISCNLTTSVVYDLRNDIINFNISSDYSAVIYWGGGVPIEPSIYTDTIIQPVSYMPNVGGFQGQ